MTQVMVTSPTSRVLVRGGGSPVSVGYSAGIDALKIRGVPVAATVPVTNQALVFNGTSWVPGSPTVVGPLAADLLFSPSGTYSIGSAGGNKPLDLFVARHGYFGGRLGIGGSDPAAVSTYPLKLGGEVTGTFILFRTSLSGSNDSTDGLIMGLDSSLVDGHNAYFRNREAGSLFFGTNGITALSIDQDAAAVFASSVQTGGVVAVNTTLDQNRILYVGGEKVGDEVSGLFVDAILTETGASAITMKQAHFAGSITTSGNGHTYNFASTVVIDEPHITKGAGDTITTAATLRIVEAPTEGVNNYALLVSSGATYLAGTVTTGAALTLGGALTWTSDGNFNIGADGSGRPLDVFAARHVQLGGRLGVAGAVPSSNSSYSIKTGGATANSFWQMVTTASGTADGSDGFIVGIDSNNDAYIINREAGELRFLTNGAQRLSIGSTGLLTSTGSIVSSADTASLSFSSSTGTKSITTGGSTDLLLNPGGGVIISSDPGSTDKFRITGSMRVNGDWTFVGAHAMQTSSGSLTIRSLGGNGAITLTPQGTGVVEFTQSRTITGGVTDGYAGALRFTPTYDAATAQTVTRHNYIDALNVAVSGAGPAAVTDACLVRFNAAAGTHKAVDAGSTKSTPGGVDAWIKYNLNGTIYYGPLYTSKTA